MTDHEELTSKLIKAIQNGDHEKFRKTRDKILYEHPNCVLSIVNSLGADGNSALHCAALQDCSYLIDRLISDLQAKVDLANNFGQTPLGVAAQAGNRNAIEEGSVQITVSNIGKLNFQGLERIY